MLPEQNHIIKKQIIELEIPTRREASAFQRKISQLYQDEILGLLQEVFDELNVGVQTIRIPKMEIDLGHIDRRRFEYEFKSKFLVMVRKKLTNEIERVSQEISKLESAHLKNSEIESSPILINDWQVFLYFLRTGVLPWHSKSLEFEQIISDLIDLSENQNLLLKKSLVGLLQNHPQSILRLIHQFPRAFLQRVLLLVWKITQEDIQILLSEVIQKKIIQEKNEVVLKRIFYSVISHLAHQTTEAGVNFSELRSRVLDDLLTSVQKRIDSKLQRTITKDTVQKEVISSEYVTEEEPKQIEADCYIENAGLIICANFLPIFLKKLDLIEGDQFVNKAAQYRAIHLTQSLVTGEECSPEYALTLNKILSGLPITESLPRNLKLSDREKEEAENLLASIIKHWSILKNSSITTLQNTFLNRKGKLTYDTHQNNWLLQVERNTYDICIERIPWTISIIQLPWMEDKVVVNWV